MHEEEPPITLGLNQPTPTLPASHAVVARPEDLQFDQAIPLDPSAAQAPLCAACKTALRGQYFQAQGVPVCPGCAQRIEAGQQAPPPVSLLRAALYGAAAAFAGFAIYAFVGIVFELELALISILIGFMVGKAVRKGSNGLGGRPQQILAVALTYFAITFSYIPVYIYQVSKSPDKAAQPRKAAASATQPLPGTEPNEPKERPSLGGAILILAGLALAAPFLSLQSGVSGLLSLAIIFFGLRNAWKLTGRTDLIVTGPYGADPR